MRFIIEGEWTGYTSAQRRVVHRTVHDQRREGELWDWARRGLGIRYTDGTSLDLRVRECTPRERVKEVHGYDSLIRDCARFGVYSVHDVCEAKRGE